ncbi:hypothetical protein Q9L58_010343 [Maublancomyces gigas]|uniref:Gag-like protein n=1 Tax=Discina gigas TaxID=1032678 RepID=A0ABR3G4F2_9PEZI
MNAGKASTTTPPPPPPSTKAPKAKKTATPLPSKSYTAIAAAGTTPPQDGWTKVNKTKKARPSPLFKPDYTKVQRELIVELSCPIPTGVTDYAIITAANTALASREVRFCLARRTTRGNILLLTRPNIAASSAEAFISPVSTALSALGCQISINHTNSRWTQFLLHGVPTTATPQEITAEIREVYPTLPPMSQTPRWLTNATTRQEKTMSTMVISFPITTALENFSLRSMTLQNHTCRLGVYLSISPSTQCSMCQAYGHHTTKCSAPPLAVPPAPATT